MPKPKVASELPLDQIVDQHLDDPHVLGRLATYVGDDGRVAQKHKDGRELLVMWNQKPGHLRCTVFLDKTTDLCLVQVNVHDDGEVGVEAWEPCRVTVSRRDNLFLLTRLQG